MFMLLMLGGPDKQDRMVASQHAVVVLEVYFCAQLLGARTSGSHHELKLVNK